MNVEISEANKLDMKDVFKMVLDLAVFENMVDQVKINARVMEVDGFESEHPPFKCFVAKNNTDVVGYALYYYCYSTWLGRSVFLEDLFVKEPYRKFGVGKRLFKSVAQVAKDISGRLDFHVLKWNPAVDFYKRLGAVNLTEAEEWNTFRMSSESLEKLLSE